MKQVPKKNKNRKKYSLESKILLSSDDFSALQAVLENVKGSSPVALFALENE